MLIPLLGLGLSERPCATRGFRVGDQLLTFLEEFIQLGARRPVITARRPPQALAGLAGGDRGVKAGRSVGQHRLFFCSFWLRSFCFFSFFTIFPTQKTNVPL